MRHDNILAIHGGLPVRTQPLPARRLFDHEELNAVQEVFLRSWKTGHDFGYQGEFEEAYTQAFCSFQGGGFADAVASGTGAVLIALAALDLLPGSEVIFSPVTDPGDITPAIWLGLKPVIADAAPGGYNLSVNEFAAAITPATRAAVITHTGGIPVDMDPIVSLASQQGIRLVEDCSQAHGAMIHGIPVGRFGDIAAFSTMFSKNHASGGCGGLVYTLDVALHHKALALADRGKPVYADFNPKDPTCFLFPALNLNQDELSCAVGRSTLRKLPETIRRRNVIVKLIAEGLAVSSCLRVWLPPSHMSMSPFFITIILDTSLLSATKMEFALAVQAEGIWVNPDYRYVVAEWPWIAPLCGKPPHTPRASGFRASSFNILFNERFTDADAGDVVRALLKVEKVFIGGKE